MLLSIQIHLFFLFLINSPSFDLVFQSKLILILLCVHLDFHCIFQLEILLKNYNYNVKNKIKELIHKLCVINLVQFIDTLFKHRFVQNIRFFIDNEYLIRYPPKCPYLTNKETNEKQILKFCAIRKLNKIDNLCKYVQNILSRNFKVNKEPIVHLIHSSLIIPLRSTNSLKL